MLVGEISCIGAIETLAEISVAISDYLGTSVWEKTRTKGLGL